jgi:NAD(P)-dependent dehydrogenase (short-subunit alcohol dehydrogenase family)
VGLTQALDREFWREDIKVTAVCPGGVETDFALGDGRTARHVGNLLQLQVLPRAWRHDIA